jgi:hypothetical protein
LPDVASSGDEAAVDGIAFWGCFLGEETDGGWAHARAFFDYGLQVWEGLCFVIGDDVVGGGRWARDGVEFRLKGEVGVGVCDYVE